MRLEVVKFNKGIHQYPYAIAGTIRQFCEKLYKELLTSGYSLLQEDIEDIALEDVKKLAGWTRLDAQALPEGDDGRYSPTFFELTLDVSLLADEWVIVEPVIRSHCDLVQAKRVEGSQALGVQPFGMGSSEALQNYTMAVETMKKEAFCHEPFTLDLDE